MTTATLPTPTKPVRAAGPSEDFHSFLETFAVYTEASQRAADIDLAVNAEILGVIDDHKADYLAALAAQQMSEEALKQWARMHPEWFGDKKSLKTPHGAVSKREVRSLLIPHEQVTLRLIEERNAGISTEFLRITKELDREALEKLTDAELAKLGIARALTEIVSVKPLTVDMGKQVGTEKAKAAKATTTGKEGK